jgi:NTP pyrophosphatase (non-canonical NTP hydrolase)
MTDRVDKDSLQLNQPRRTPSHPTKSHIVKTKVDGKEKIIRFGEQGASTAGKPKEGESDRMKAKRASFKSRHAKNIAKGPSSPAYWANKVKWADGGFVKTNYYDGGSMRAQPQNAALGAIADFLKQTYSPRRTQQLQGTMEFLGVPALARTTERLSYGQPITNVNKANVPLLPDDTAEAAMLVAPPLASLAKRVGTNLVQTAPYVARDIVQNVTSPLKSYAVKPKGGNWEPARGSRDSVTMSVNPIKRNPDVISGDMINQAAGEDLWSKMVDMDVYHYPSAWLRENRPDVLNNLLGPEKGAVNKWLDSKLEKYIRNDMGTPDDPVRLAHEEGFSHIPGEAEELGAWLPEDVAAMRVKAGYPEEGFAVRKHAEAGFPEATEVNARKAEMWEALSDAEITASPAGTMKEAFRLAEQFPDASGGNKNLLWMKKNNPWIEKLDRETPIYRIDRPMDLNENLGFGHMADEIENMLDPESGLPAALRMTPQQLDKVTMKQMVEKVDAVNKWRSEEAAKAELGDMMGNLTATARLEVPDAQLSFVKEPGMKWIDIPATTDESAMKLCTTIGRQAGWCTQGEGLAKRYGSGDNSLTTLIDAEGRPHAQAMLGKPNQSSYDAWFNKYKDTPEVDEFLNWEGQPKVTGSLDKRYQAWAKETGRPIEQVPQDIIELKPVENAFNSERAREYTKRDPDYKNKITDSVLDFLKSGSWGDVKDLHHYDIIDAKNPSAIRKFINDNYGGDFGMVDANTIQKDFMKNYNGERFIKAEQFSDLVSDYIPKADGYKEGGSVDADEQAAFGIYPSAGKRSQKSDIGDKLNASLVPQDALDLALTVLPFGKVGKTLAAAIVSGAPAEAQAGNMSSLLKLVAREAPEQFQSIREALLRTFNTGLEHSVIGSTRMGGPSKVVQGVNDSVMPNRLDVVKARRNIDQSGLIDFHTHPRQNNSVSEFKVTPSDADLQTWMTYYGGSRTATTPNEIKTMVGSPFSRQDGVTSAYNFFATNKPNQTLDRRAYDAARYELQRSKPLQALKDIPEVRQYLDTGGTLGDVLSAASPMALQKLYAQKGLGRHDMRLSNAPVAGPLGSESNLFDQIVNPAMEVLDSKKFGSFADGGIVQQNPTTDQMRYELMMRRK